MWGKRDPKIIFGQPSLDGDSLMNNIEANLIPRLPKPSYIRKPQAFQAAWSHPPTVYLLHQQNYVLIDWRVQEESPEIVELFKPWTKYLTKDVEQSDYERLSEETILKSEEVSTTECIDNRPWVVGPWLPYHDLIAQRVIRAYKDMGFPMYSSVLEMEQIDPHTSSNRFDVSLFLPPQAWRSISYKTEHKKGYGILHLATRNA